MLSCAVVITCLTHTMGGFWVWQLYWQNKFRANNPNKRMYALHNLKHKAATWCCCKWKEHVNDRCAHQTWCPYIAKIPTILKLPTVSLFSGKSWWYPLDHLVEITMTMNLVIAATFDKGSDRVCQYYIWLLYHIKVVEW